jgi:uncharacterized OB-fold protein
MTLPDHPPRFDTDIVRPFWEALERGEFHLPACSVCGGWQWYPFDFVRCHDNAELVWKPAPRTGTVFTCTRVHRSFLPNAKPDEQPYVAALVELDGAPGARLATFLVNLGEHEPRIGMRVRLCPVRRSTYTAPAFEPAD